eukprot:813007-Prymnesium_polylepis.1
MRELENFIRYVSFETWQARGHPNLGRGKRADFRLFECPPDRKTIWPHSRGRQRSRTSTV